MISPATPGVAAARRTCSSEPTPPDAITGIATARGEQRGAVEVGTATHPVVRNLRVDERSDAGVLEELRELHRGGLAGLEPARHGDAAAAGVDADRDASWPTARRLAHQIGIAQRGGAEDRALDAEPERVLDRRERAHAAAELDRHVLGGRDDRPHRIAIVRRSGPRAVQVDAVHARRTDPHEPLGNGARIVGVDRDAIVVALRQAHTAPAQQIDRGDHLEHLEHSLDPCSARRRPASRENHCARRQRNLLRHLHRAEPRQLLRRQPARAATGVLRRGERVLAERHLRVVEGAGPEQLAAGRGVDLHVEADAGGRRACPSPRRCGRGTCRRCR